MGAGRASHLATLNVLTPKAFHGCELAWTRQCRHFGRHFVNTSETSVTTVLLSVLLDSRGAQAGEAVLVDRILPGEELFDRQRIAAACLFE